jgi:hypothetical protein
MLQLPLVLPPQRRVLRGNLDFVAAWKQNHVTQVRNLLQEKQCPDVESGFPGEACRCKSLALINNEGEVDAVY